MFCFELPDIQQPLPDLSLYWQIPPLDHLSVLAYIWNLKRFKEMVKTNRPNCDLNYYKFMTMKVGFLICGFLNPSLIALQCRQGLYLTVILMHYPSQFHCLTIYIDTWILSSPEPKALLNISCCSGLLIYHYLAFHMITWLFIPLPGCLYQHLAFFNIITWLSLWSLQQCWWGWAPHQRSGDEPDCRNMTKKYVHCIQNKWSTSDPLEEISFL